MTTALAHEVDLDGAPLGGRRRSYTPRCRTCGWTSAESFRDQVTAAQAAVEHARAAS